MDLIEMTKLKTTCLSPLHWKYWIWSSKKNGLEVEHYISFDFLGKVIIDLKRSIFITVVTFPLYIDVYTLRRMRRRTWWWSVSPFWWCLCCLWRGWCGSSGECHSWARFPWPPPSLVVTSRYTPEGHPPVTENQDKITIIFFWNKI